MRCRVRRQRKEIRTPSMLTPHRMRDIKCLFVRSFHGFNVIHAGTNRLSFLESEMRGTADSAAFLSRNNRLFGVQRAGGESE